jgi:hypothetical protein
LKVDIITVTESKSMPGRYMFSVQRRGRMVFSDHDAGLEPCEAAATAMNAAIKSRNGYVIFGPQRVMQNIPISMRSKNDK